MKALIDFTHQHSGLALPIVFLLGFCESFTFVSVLVPATTILLGLGLLIGASGLDFWPIWTSTVFGTILGGWLAYEVGFRFQGQIFSMWPARRYPEAMLKGGELFVRWGAFAVLVCRFSAPLRATVPMIAGVYQLSFFRFQLANTASALLWTTGIFVPGLVWPTQ